MCPKVRILTFYVDHSTEKAEARHRQIRLRVKGRAEEIEYWKAATKKKIQPEVTSEKKTRKYFRMGKTGRKWTQNRIHFWILIWKMEIQPEKMNYSIIWACYLRFTDLKVPPLPWIALQTDNIRKGDQAKGVSLHNCMTRGGWVGVRFFQTAVYGFLILSNEIKADVCCVLVQSLWLVGCSWGEEGQMVITAHAGWEGMASAVDSSALSSTGRHSPHHKMIQAGRRERGRGSFSCVKLYCFKMPSYFLKNSDSIYIYGYSYCACAWSVQKVEEWT
jgi:hypothetical protein